MKEKGARREKLEGLYNLHPSQSQPRPLLTVIIIPKYFPSLARLLVHYTAIILLGVFLSVISQTAPFSMSSLAGAAFFPSTCPPVLWTPVWI